MRVRYCILALTPLRYLRFARASVSATGQGAAHWAQRPGSSIAHCGMSRYIARTLKSVAWVSAAADTVGHE